MALSVQSVWGARGGTATEEPEPITTLERRRELVKQLAAAAYTRDPSIKQEREEIVAAREAIEARYRALLKRESDEAGRAGRLDRQRIATRTELLSTSPPEIGAAISELESRIEAAQRAVRTHHRENTPQPGSTRDFGRNARISILSNRVSVDLFTISAREAITKLNDLKLTAMDQRALARKIKSVVGAVRELNLELVEEVKK